MIRFQHLFPEDICCISILIPLAKHSTPLIELHDYKKKHYFPRKRKKKKKSLHFNCNSKVTLAFVRNALVLRPSKPRGCLARLFSITQLEEGVAADLGTRQGSSESPSPFHRGH